MKKELVRERGKTYERNTYEVEYNSNNRAIVIAPDYSPEENQLSSSVILVPKASIPFKNSTVTDSVLLGRVRGYEKVDIQSSVIIGIGAGVENFENYYTMDSVVIGHDARVSDVEGDWGNVAIGSYSSALHENSVAVGTGTGTARPNTGTFGFRDIQVLGSTNGLLLSSPNNKLWRVKVSDGGTLTVTEVTS